MTDKTEAMDLTKTLAELSARASGGQWHHQSGGVTGSPWISTDNWTRQDGTYVRGGCILNMVAHDERQDDAAFIAALVNAYRTGKMIVVPEDAVERMARALAVADGIEICSDAIYALSSYGHRATAALASLKGADHAG